MLPVEHAINSIKGIGTRECEPWREKILLRHPAIAVPLAKGYLRINNDKGYVTANQWLLNTSQNLKLGRTGLSLFGTSEELTNYAQAKARKTHRQIYEAFHALGKDAAPNNIRQIVERTGVQFPLGDEYNQEGLIAALARVSDDKWWKNQLRPKQWREAEDFIRSTGCVNKTKQIYISDFSLRRRLEQKRHNQSLLDKLEAENEEGKTYTLSELAELSPSNPVIRRAELMVRLSGCESFANNSDVSFQGICYTLTCPSKFHPVHRHGKPNTKYDGSTGQQAQDHLNTVWSRTRAAFARADIEVFGMRVAEPQHDGTPHWHILLFIRSDQVKQTTELFRHYALEVDGDEPGAKEHRLDTLLIDPKKGTATGYLAKYIAKNIDGHQVGMDNYGKDAITSAIRVEAWASIHSIRQFQQIGGASITVWRELRRLESEGIEKGLLKALIKAADESDWETYNSLMGGMTCPRKERPVRPMMIQRAESNQYGEMVRVIKGIWHGIKAVITRQHEWTVRLVQNSEAKNQSEDGTGDGVALSTAPPGACVTLEFCQ